MASDPPPYGFSSPYPPPPYPPYSLPPYPPYSPYPPYPPPPPLEGLGDFFVVFVDLLTLISYGVLVALILKDGWRAFKKRATWLPGTAFALSGLTVQILAWWTSIKHITNIHELDMETLAEDYQLALSGRVAVCVFIGYLLPGMATPHLRAFVALAIAMCAQIGSELIIAYPANRTNYVEDSSRTWLIKVNLIILICIVVLALILSCTVLASKTIRGLLKERICTISPTLEEDEFQVTKEETMSTSWNDFDDEVLKSWFVARVCQVDYVISRSVLSSAVFVVVTICVILFTMSNTSHNQYIYYTIEAIILSPLFSFIIIGWFVICWRWLAAQLYFRPRKSRKRFLCVEDFWTRRIAEWIHMYDLKSYRQRLQRSSSKMRSLKRFCCLPTKMFRKLRLHKLLYFVLMIQVIVVLFSKLCGFLSEITVGKFVYWCRKHTRKGGPVASSERYERISVASNKNYAEILECVCMPGEDPSDLWEANEMSFKKLSLRIKNCCKKARESDEINSFFSSFSLQCAEEGTRVVDKLKKQAMPSVLKHFPDVENRCVKITVVSLITIFIELHKAKSDRSKALLNACCGVWDLLSFENECNVNAHEDHNGVSDQVGMAADRKLYALQIKHNKLPPSSQESVMDAGAARDLLRDLSAKCEGLLKRGNLLGDSHNEHDAGLRDSKDWMKIAPSYHLYKLCNFMLEESTDDFVAWTETSVINVIACFVTNLPDMIVKQCWKWAKEFEEDRIWEAIRVAGKCRGMMEAWDLEPKFTMKTIKQWTIQVDKSAHFMSAV